MTANLRWSAACALIATLSLLTSTASADPLTGQVLKFQQLPLNVGLPPSVGGAPFPGHNELSTALAVHDDLSGDLLGWNGTYMADDFADLSTTPVVHVRWWGSYLQIPQGQIGGVRQFLISFESDVAAMDGEPSHPGIPLLNQIVDVTGGPLAPGSGMFNEKLINADVPEPLYEYNAELHMGKEFMQEPNTVYWLKIVALVDPDFDGPLAWGWHTRDWSIPDPYASKPPLVVPGEHIAGTVGVEPTIDVWHFQDDAVTGGINVQFIPEMPKMPNVVQQNYIPQNYRAPDDGPPEIVEFSKDLAFELYTIPEPSTLVLLSVGVVAMVLFGRRRRQ